MQADLYNGCKTVVAVVVVVVHCKVRSQYICFKYLLTKLSNNIDVFVIFRWSFTLAIFETIAETTEEILEN